MERMTLTGWIVPLTLAFLLALPEASYSQEPEIVDLVDTDEEDEFIDEFTLLMEDAGIVESAARHKQEIGMSPSAITVITRQDIEASGATNIPDLLRLVPGMNVVVSNPFFLAITTRLFFTEEGNHILVLIDGREINFEPLGFPPWEITPILLEDVERIEIIRGPGSALYGANALTGVVSITTRSVPDKTSARIHLEAGEAGRIISGVKVSTKLGSWGISISGANDFSGTFLNPRDTSKEVWKFRTFIEHRWSDSERLLVDIGISRGTGPIPSPMGTVHSDFDPNSLRVAYESEKLTGQLYWSYVTARAEIKAPLEYSGIRLATFIPAPMRSHVIDGQIQWTPPRFWDPLLLIVGGGARASWVGSDALLDAETFSDPTSPEYRESGVSHWEIRTGTFVHAEFAPADWITVTGGSRVDYNTQTGVFVSPRLAAVFQPTAGQFVRLGAARSFRKPSFMETGMHLMVDFPDDSPITGAGRDHFQEFMTRVGGYNGLENEELTAFEVGYLGQFLDDRLSISLDLYCNLLRELTVMTSNILEDERGLPDLEQSSFTFSNNGPEINVFGSELSIRFTPSKRLSFLASWSNRQVVNVREKDPSASNPQNLITLGGRFQLESGLVGSLYAFSRSEMQYYSLENPSGLLEPLLTRHADHVILFLGKLGWRFEIGPLKAETGVKLFLPVSPFSAPHFGYYESAGAVTPMGRPFGASQLARMVTGYLQGSF
jgi:iron complex outermembrane receptor protein